MKAVSFLSLFGDYLDNSILAYFGNATVESIEATLADRAVSMVVSFGAPVDTYVIKKAQDELKRVMNLREIRMDFRFPSESLDLNYISGFVKEIYENFPASKSILEGAEYNFSVDKLTINLASNGKDTLINLGCDKFIRDTLDSRFERLVKVEFISNSSSEDDVEKLIEYQKKENQKLIEAQPKKQPAVAKPSGGEPAPRKPVEQTYEDLPISLSNAKPIYGPAIKVKPKPIAECLPEDGEVVIWGDIFAVDVKESRDGKYSIINFSLTDYTSSYIVKVFGEKKKCTEIVDTIKKGITVMVRGPISRDTCQKSYIITARAIMLIDKIKKKDEAPEKRVELHLHTNMSTMDGMTSAKALVSGAADWGQNAMAITDHGWVQGFPEACNTAAKAGIKIIYGMEGYLVDDDEFYPKYNFKDGDEIPSGFCVVNTLIWVGARNWYRSGL